MDITFGICTANKNLPEKYINDLFLIAGRNEVVVASDSKITSIGVGSTYSSPKQYKNGWITKKKNDIAQMAYGKYVCIIHDYYTLPENFLEKTEYFIEKNGGLEDSVLIPVILNQEGNRHSDWIVDPLYMKQAIDTNPDYWRKRLMSVAPKENAPEYVCGLPYEVHDMSKKQYCSGGFIFTTKDVLLKVPLDENLMWGQAEDLEWSRRLVANGVKFKFNPFTHATANKPNKWHVHEMPEDFVDVLRKI